MLFHHTLNKLNLVCKNLFNCVRKLEKRIFSAIHLQAETVNVVFLFEAVHFFTEATSEEEEEEKKRSQNTSTENKTVGKSSKNSKLVTCIC